MNLRRTTAVLSVLLAAFPPGARAQVLKLRSTTADGQKLNLVEELSLKGDLRLRHESFNKKSGAQAARQRQRYRLRLQGDIKLPHELAAGLHLASGTGEQVSTNQSLDNLGSQKAIFIDRVFLSWKPELSDDGSLSLSAGKIGNPLWTATSSDAIWDPDFNPEGFGEKLEWFLPALKGIYFLNAMQMVVDEDATSTADQWLFAQQAGGEWRLPGSTRLRLAGAFYHWVNERASSFGQAVVNEGNRRDGGGILLSEFDVLELTGRYSLWLGRTPLALQATWLKNTAAKQRYLETFRTRANDVGYQLGGILGAAEQPGSWELGYFHKWLESDATVADLADSDWGDGGTNRRGHIFWLAYAPRDWMQLKAKYFYTRLINDRIAPGGAAVVPDDINRFQLDWVVKF